MRANAAMSRSLLSEPSQTEPKHGSGAVWEQTSLDFRSFLEWREEVYQALRDGVEVGFSKMSDFADEIGKSTAEVSLRLRHAEDSKGYPQLAPVDYIAKLAQRPGALEKFLERLARAKKHKLVFDGPPADAVVWRKLARDMTPKQRRAAEKEHGWPHGYLDE